VNMDSMSTIARALEFVKTSCRRNGIPEIAYQTRKIIDLPLVY